MLQSLAYKAYGQVQHRTASEHEIEYALFKQITEALQDVAGQDKPEPALWADAVSRNLQLWTILAADLLDPANPIPVETKGGLLSLSEFVRKTSLTALSGKCDIADLIEVNTTIMQGLAASRTHVFEEGAA